MIVLMQVVLTMPPFQLSEMTLDHDDGPAPTGSEEAPSGERKAPAAKPRKKERKRSELRVRWIECENISSALSFVTGHHLADEHLHHGDPVRPPGLLRVHVAVRGQPLPGRGRG